MDNGNPVETCSHFLSNGVISGRYRALVNIVMFAVMLCSLCKNLYKYTACPHTWITQKSDKFETLGINIIIILFFKPRV